LSPGSSAERIITAVFDPKRKSVFEKRNETTPPNFNRALAARLLQRSCPNRKRSTGAVVYVDRAPDVAMQFVVAEKEELMDNKDNGIMAYQRAKGPKNLVMIPEITHYGVYIVPSASPKGARVGDCLV
jgi:hypothetical protein